MKGFRIEGDRKANAKKHLKATLEMMQRMGMNPDKFFKMYLNGKKFSSLTTKQISGLNGCLKDKALQSIKGW
jgi:hypothetical protein